MIPILVTDVGKTELEQEEPAQHYLFGFLPYKWMKIKHYESRCFKPLYRENAVRTIDKYTGLFTKYLIDISVSRSVKKDYKQNGEKYKDFIYNRFPINPLKEETPQPKENKLDDLISSFKAPNFSYFNIFKIDVQYIRFWVSIVI